jgi:5-methylcytosine-specific restriction endonuclease McrA
MDWHDPEQIKAYKRHVDHAVPFARGGHDIMSNLRVCCPRCNMKKSNKTAKEFVLLLKRKS